MRSTHCSIAHILNKYFISFITIGLPDFVHRPEFYKQENTAFRKLDLFPSSGEGGGPTLLGNLFDIACG
jgi:hypothetical protein